MHHYELNTHERGQLKRVFVLEECHHLLSKQFRKTTSTEDILENMLREAREFGTAFIMLFQSVSSIPNTALSNIHTIICHNLVHDLDLQAMAGILLLDSKERKYISQLRVGQALVKLQSRYTKPFLIDVPLLNVDRDRILSDLDIRTQKGAYSANPKPSSAVSPKEQSDSPVSPSAINVDEFAFLESITSKPFMEQQQGTGNSASTTKKGMQSRQGC